MACLASDADECLSPLELALRVGGSAGFQGGLTGGLRRVGWSGFPASDG